MVARVAALNLSRPVTSCGATGRDGSDARSGRADASDQRRTSRVTTTVSSLAFSSTAPAVVPAAAPTGASDDGPYGPADDRADDGSGNGTADRPTGLLVTVRGPGHIVLLDPVARCRAGLGDGLLARRLVPRVMAGSPVLVAGRSAPVANPSVLR